MDTIKVGKHILNELSNDTSPRKRPKLDRNSRPSISVDENHEPQEIPTVNPSVTMSNDYAGVSSTSKDGATPTASVAAHAFYPYRVGGPTNVAYGQQDDVSLLNITGGSIGAEQANDPDSNSDATRMTKRMQQNPGHVETYADAYGGPPDGRAIVNTSLIKLATQNQHRGRSPLTAVKSNMNGTADNAEAGQKRNMAAIAENGFFLYQRKLPQTYFGEDNFGKLSDEMILSVFKFLPKKALMRCSLVSRRFNAVSLDETLWSRLDMSVKHLRTGALGRIISRGVIVLRSAQTKISDPIFDMSEISSDYVSKLQYLDLSMADISTTGLTELLSRCRSLKKLSLEHIPLDSEVCAQIAANKKLEALNVTMCTGIDVQSIQKMMNSLVALQSLNISWTNLNTDFVMAFVQSVPVGLLRLNIAGCRKSMSDSSLLQLVTRCPNLIELDLSDCTILSSEAIKIVCILKHLEYLSLSRCYNIAVASYLAINELISLAYLDIFGVLSEQAITMLQTSFPSVGINKFIHSAVARPTVGSRRTSIWGLRTRD